MLLKCFVKEELNLVEINDREIYIGIDKTNRTISINVLLIYKYIVIIYFTYYSNDVCINTFSFL